MKVSARMENVTVKADCMAKMANLRYDGHGNVESRAKKVISTAGAGR